MPVTLLLADDSVTIQRVIELTFASEDVRVVAVGDGQAALKFLEKEQPDIVLADVGMPKVDGYGVAEAVKKSTKLKDTPVLLLTGAFEPIDEDRARATGCDGVLVKPFAPHQLVSRVRELLAGRHSQELWPDEMPRVDAPPARPAGARASAAQAQARQESSPSLRSEAALELELNQLDSAWTPAPDDRSPARTAAAGASSAGFGDWDLPTTAAAAPERLDLSGTPFAARPPEPQSLATLEPLEPLPVATRPVAPVPARPVAAARPARPQVSPAPPIVAPAPQAVAPAPQPAPTPVAAADPRAAAAPASEPKVSIAGAFTALLAAEQSRPATETPTTTQLSDAVVEEMVRRTLARLTEGTVRSIVLEVAEKLIREEIERIKAHPGT
jgi:CheY-like chemotaxis protein